MGSQISRSLKPEREDFDYMCISLQPFDHLHIIHGNKHVWKTVKLTTEETWIHGIQCVYNVHGCQGMQLRGRPFLVKVYDHREPVEPRILCGEILRSFYAQGWKLVASSDLTRTVNLSTCFFHQSHNSPATVPKKIVCLSVCKFDSLQLIGQNEILHSVMEKAIGDYYHDGVDNVLISGQTLLYKLRGYPWKGDGGEKIAGRLIILELFKQLEKRDLTFYGTINFNGLADSMYFMEDVSESQRHHFEYFMLALDKCNRIRLISCTQSIIEKIRICILRYWPQGLDFEGQHYQAYEFQIGGSPWWAEGEEAINSRFFIARLLQMLLEQGWEVHAALDLTRRHSDKSCFIMRSCIPKQGSVMCVSPCDIDKIRVIGAPPVVDSMISSTIKEHWTYGLKSRCIYGGATEFKAYSNTMVHARSLMCHILQALNEDGWQHLASADISAKYRGTQSSRTINLADDSYPIDVHSWFFFKNKDLMHPDRVSSLHEVSMPADAFVKATNRRKFTNVYLYA